MLMEVGTFATLCEFSYATKEILKVHTKKHNPENDTSVINATTRETISEVIIAIYGIIIIMNNVNSKLVKEAI